MVHHRSSGFRSNKKRDLDAEAAVAPRAREIYVNEKTGLTADDGDKVAIREQKKIDRAYDKREQQEAKEKLAQEKREAKEKLAQEKREAKEKQELAKKEAESQHQKEEKPGFWKSLFGSKEERIGGNGNTRDSHGAVEVASLSKLKAQGKAFKGDSNLYYDAPANWGQMTPDLQKQLKDTPHNTIVMQTTKISSRNGYELVYGTLVGNVDGKSVVLPMISGGARYNENSIGGAAPGLVYGTGNNDSKRHGGVVVGEYKIIRMSDHHLKDWGCRVAILSTPEGTGRSEILGHRIARSDGMSSGCICVPREYQAPFERMLAQNTGGHMAALPSTQVGGLAYNQNRDMDKVRDLAKNFKGDDYDKSAGSNPKYIQVAQLEERHKGGGRGGNN